MGTGSGGGGGSGGGSGGSGSSASEGGLGEFDHYHFGATKKGPPSARKLEKTSDAKLREKVIKLLLSRGRRSYLHMQFSSTVLAEAYRIAFDLVHDASKVAKRLKIDPGPGFLIRVIEKLGDRWREVESEERVRHTARNTLEHFLWEALGDRISIYLEGDCSAVKGAMVPKVVKSTSGYFLGKFLWHLLEREIERLPKDQTERLMEVSQEVADDLLKEFDSRYVQGEKSRGKTYAALFDLLGGGQNEEPAIDEMLRELRR